MCKALPLYTVKAPVPEALPFVITFKIPAAGVPEDPTAIGPE